MKLFPMLLLIPVLCACATMGTVENAPTGDGVSQVFKANYDTTAAAALAAVQSLNVTVKETKPIDGGSEILFAKPMSAFSWGEVGRVTVKRLDASSTVVSVLSAKRYTVQVSGASQKDFASAIFSGVAERLPK